MSLSRIVNLLQTVCFLLFCVVGLVFLCADVYWYYILDSNARWETIIHHSWSYECIWYLDCFTFVFMYLWIAVKLLRAACNPKKTLEALERRFKISTWRRDYIKPCITFDTLFKMIVVIIGLVILKHALSGGIYNSSYRLNIISDIRPMANIWYDIVCPLQWLWNIICH